MGLLVSDFKVKNGYHLERTSIIFNQLAKSDLFSILRLCRSLQIVSC